MSTALFVFIRASAALSSLVIILVLVLGTNAAQSEKLSSYECGFEPFGDSRQRFDISYYLVGLLFRIFDIEIAFRFPWSVLVLSGSKLLLGLILAFSLILIIGFGLEMKLGVLDGKGKSTTLMSMINCGLTNENFNTKSDVV